MISRTLCPCTLNFISFVSLQEYIYRLIYIMGSSSLENRRMLKDFLVDDELPCCSSNNEILIKKKSYWHPRKPCKLRSSSAGRNRSKAASISISAVHRASDMVINAIKSFPFINTTPAINNYLPRSISRKLSSCSSSRNNRYVVDVQVLDHPSVYNKVKIKDILRWKSFRDIPMEMEEIVPLPSTSCVDLTCLPHQTMITRGSSSIDSTTSGSKTSSIWFGPDDFTVDDEGLTPDKDCLNDDGLELSKHNYLPQFPDQGTIISKRELQFNEEEQHSPVSVLDSPFHHEDEAFFFFQRNLAAMERRKCRLMQRIQNFENLGFKTLEERSSDYLPADDDAAAVVREKAAELFNRVEGITPAEYSNQVLLLDFFIEKLTAVNDGCGRKLDDLEILRLAESWLSNTSNYKEAEEKCNSEWEIMKMEIKGFGSWNIGNFDEETRELGCKLEIMVLNDLIDDILSHLLSIK